MTVMEYIVKLLTTFGIIAGAVDLLFLKGKWKLGEKFQQGFEMIGSMMLSMTGILMLAPAAASLLEHTGVSFLRSIRMDPSVLSIFFSCDMGGYALAQSLADDPATGLMLGMVTAGMFGGALNFTIPLGFGIIDKSAIPGFSKGVLFGLGFIPAGNLVSGLILGLSLRTIIWNSLPVLILSVFIIIGMIRSAEKMVHLMDLLASAMRILGIVGIVLGALDYLLGVTIIPDMDSLMDSMLLVCQMTVTMIGMLPVMELVSRLLKKPLEAAGRRAGLDAVSISGMIFSLVSCAPVFPMMKEMNLKGQIINGAWAILVAAVFGSQLGLAMSSCPEVLPALLSGKLAAGIAGTAAILVFCRAEDSAPDGSRIPASGQ